MLVLCGHFGDKFHYSDRLRDIKTTPLSVGRTSSIDLLVETRRGDLKNTLEIEQSAIY